jgi:TRAP transporter TAXI family solute receptor
VQATKASVENLNLLQQGNGEIAFTIGDSLADAWNGNAEVGFKSKLDKLRTVAAIYPNFIQIAALKDSGVKTLADLKGKRLSVGAPKSGTGSMRARFFPVLDWRTATSARSSICRSTSRSS